MTEKTKVGNGPLCDQMQALQERARKLHPIDLHDPQLDTADPYTRLFLLAEYWQRQAKGARACLDDECDRTDSLLTILGLECDACRSEGGSLIPLTVITLMAEAGHPPRFSERDCELIGNGLAYIIREYPDKAEHARALLERMKPANVRANPAAEGGPARSAKVERGVRALVDLLGENDDRKTQSARDDLQRQPSRRRRLAPRRPGRVHGVVCGAH